MQIKGVPCRFTNLLYAFTFTLLSMSPSAAFAGTASIAKTAPGPTPFIEFVTATYTGSLKDVSYQIVPVAGSLTRPLIANYSAQYLRRTGHMANDTLTFSVFGLYAGRNNVVQILFRFQDGTSTQMQTTITTPAFAAPCAGVQSYDFTQNRTSTAQLQFDYFVLKSFCNAGIAEIFDTDGNIRWSGVPQRNGLAQPSGL